MTPEKNMKNQKNPSEYERFMALSDEQKDREVARYDRRMPRGRPLTKAQKALHSRARKMGRPRIGKARQDDCAGRWMRVAASSGCLGEA